LALAIGVSLAGTPGPVDDDRAQPPPLLAKAFFEFSLAYIDYPFTMRQLEPGFQAESIRVPHLAARLGLFGYRFNEHLAAQLSYMRPVEWVGYDGVNGIRGRHTVWMNVVGLSVHATTPIAGRFSIDGEAGVALVTRHGFSV